VPLYSLAALPLEGFRCHRAGVSEFKMEGIRMADQGTSDAEQRHPSPLLRIGKEWAHKELCARGRRCLGASPGHGRRDDILERFPVECTTGSHHEQTSLLRLEA
jgi:hypothetical protein